MCVVTLELCENRLSHIGHLKFNFFEIRNEYPTIYGDNILYLNGFCPVCVRTCAVKLAACEKLLLQSGHL